MRSIEELRSIKAEMERTMAVREDTGAPSITVHMGTCGIANGAREVLIAVMSELQARSLSNIHVTQTGCPGICHQEPLVTITNPGKTPFMYGKITPDKVKKLILQHIVNGQPVTEWLVNLGE